MKPTSPRRSRRIPLLAVAAILSLFAAREIVLRLPAGKLGPFEVVRQSAVRLSPKEQKRLAEEAERGLRDLREKYRNSQVQVTLQTRDNLEKILEEVESKLPERAHTDTQALRGFTNAARCVALGAKDAAFNSTDLAAYVGHVMAPTEKLLSETRSRILGELETFRHRSQALVNDFESETLSFRNELAGQGLRLESTNLERIAQSVGSARQAASGIAITLAIESLFIKSTIDAIKRPLGFLIGRQAAALLGGTGAAVADGPVPIGDAIGLTIIAGSSIWSAIDLINASRQLESLPGDVEKAMRDELSKIKDQAESQLRELNASYSALYDVNEK